MSTIELKKITFESWPEVSKIYNQGLSTGNATFEQNAPEWEAWDQSHHPFCRLIAEMDGKVVGWAALTKVSNRCVYSGVAEVSIYVDENYQKQGVGTFLMKFLIAESEHNGIWTLQAGIFPENVASVRLHKKSGFRIIGIREKLGKMDDTWRDVALLDRRSRVVGASE